MFSEIKLEYIIFVLSFVLWLITLLVGIYMYVFKTTGRRADMYKDISVTLLTVSVGFVVVMVLMYLFYPGFLNNFIDYIIRT